MLWMIFMWKIMGKLVFLFFKKCCLSFYLLFRIFSVFFSHNIYFPGNVIIVDFFGDFPQIMELVIDYNTLKYANYPSKSPIFNRTILGNPDTPGTFFSVEFYCFYMRVWSGWQEGGNSIFILSVFSVNVKLAKSVLFSLFLFWEVILRWKLS